MCTMYLERFRWLLSQVFILSKFFSLFCFCFCFFCRRRRHNLAILLLLLLLLSLLFHSIHDTFGVIYLSMLLSSILSFWKCRMNIYSNHFCGWKWFSIWITKPYVGVHSFSAQNIGENRIRLPNMLVQARGKVRLAVCSFELFLFDYGSGWTSA